MTHPATLRSSPRSLPPNKATDIARRTANILAGASLLVAGYQFGNGSLYDARAMEEPPCTEVASDAVVLAAWRGGSVSLP